MELDLRPRSLLLGASILLGTQAAPAIAQHQNMPGMTMPEPAKKKAPAKKRPAKKPVPTQRASHPPTEPAPTNDSQMPMDHSEHGAMPMPSQPAPGGDESMPMDHSQHGAMPMAGMQPGEHAGHQMAMTGALGSYPMERESSGTAWQPDSSEHAGLHVMSGDWMLMAHGALNLVYDHQSGPRGDDKTFVSGMLMGMA